MSYFRQTLVFHAFDLFPSFLWFPEKNIVQDPECPQWLAGADLLQVRHARDCGSLRWGALPSTMEGFLLE